MLDKEPNMLIGPPIKQVTAPVMSIKLDIPLQVLTKLDIQLQMSTKLMSKDLKLLTQQLTLENK